MSIFFFSVLLSNKVTDWWQGFYHTPEAAVSGLTRRKEREALLALNSAEKLYCPRGWTACLVEGAEDDTYEVCPRLYSSQETDRMLTSGSASTLIRTSNRAVVVCPVNSTVTLPTPLSVKSEYQSRRRPCLSVSLLMMLAVLSCEELFSAVPHV